MIVVELDLFWNGGSNTHKKNVSSFVHWELWKHWNAFVFKEPSPSMPMVLQAVANDMKCSIIKTKE